MLRNRGAALAVAAVRHELRLRNNVAHREEGVQFFGGEPRQGVCGPANAAHQFGNMFYEDDNLVLHTFAK